MDLTGKKILVIDPSPRMRSVLAEGFMGVGCVVDTAASGRDAFEKLTSLPPPDVILSEALMPRMDGFALLKKIKKDERLKNIPFLFLTDDKHADILKEHALKCGAQFYLLKPIDTADLISIVSQTVWQTFMAANRTAANDEFPSTATTPIAEKSLSTDAPVRPSRTQLVCGFVRKLLSDKP